MEKLKKLPWYIHLNFLVLGFLCVVFLIRQIQKPSFELGLKALLFSPAAENRERPARILKPNP